MLVQNAPWDLYEIVHPRLAQKSHVQNYSDVCDFLRQLYYLS
jgi:hypothetical protein